MHAIQANPVLLHFPSLSKSYLTQTIRRSFFSKRLQRLSSEWPARGRLDVVCSAMGDAGEEDKREERSLLLFKTDLRMDDHPGLDIAASSSQAVIPFYCFDPHLLTDLADIPGGIELLWGALRSLKTSLEMLQSDLVVRVGTFREVLPEVLQQFGCTSLVAELDIEHNWRQEFETVKRISPHVEVKEWQTSLYAEPTYDEDFQRCDRRGLVREPLVAVTNIPSFPPELNPAPFPTLAAFKQLFDEHLKDCLQVTSNRKDPFQGREESLWFEFAFALSDDSQKPVLFINDYLRLSGEPADERCRDILCRVIKNAEDERFPGISFAALFALPLSLGLISVSRLYSEISRRKKEIGWSNSFFPDPYVEAAEGLCISTDFHRQLARQELINGSRTAPGSSKIMFWKWQGLIHEYAMATPNSNDNQTIVVLVHGFGASSMHWRRNVDALTSAGYTVFSPTLPGYGKSQKICLKYTEIVWQEFLTSFIQRVVGKPVVLVGNSIGAFVAAQTAALHPSIVSRLILINPAGRIEPDYVPGDRTPAFPFSLPSYFTDFLSRALLLYLSITAPSTLQALYPRNVEKADHPFLEDILRASRDPNAVEVLKSVFFLQRPMALNYLLSSLYRGRILLLQGTLDPLSKAADRAKELSELCSNMTVYLVEGGHCPHDEIPEIINHRLISFLKDAS